MPTLRDGRKSERHCVPAIWGNYLETVVVVVQKEAGVLVELQTGDQQSQVKC